MVSIVGKMDLDSDANKKLNVFKIRIIEIMTKNNKTTLPLGKVLHECGSVKADIKKVFKKYNIPKEDRSKDNDNFNWQKFFDENLYPEFEVDTNHIWDNGSQSDALTYRPPKEANAIGNNAVTKSTKKEEPKKIEAKDIDKHTPSETVEKQQIAANEVETEKPEIKMTQEEIYNLLNKLLDELNNGLYEKERSIRLTLLAVLAGESTFMLGEPGTAKSLVARRISEAFEDSQKDGEIKFFDYLMNQFSTPEEIFGPISIQELKNDKYIRKTENYLPKAQFAFLDEIWKANPAIQNALLTILNEKIFRNGVQVEKVPLIGFMSASNELPEKGKGLEAIFDRFLVRILEKPIADNDNFRKMISAERKMDATISKELQLSEAIIQTILNESEAVEISDDCFNIIDSIRKILAKKNTEINDEDEKYLVSDRRWKKIANLMCVSAYCNNRIETDIMDATLIADCIWNTETQEGDVKQIVADAIKAYGVKCKSNVKDLKSKVKEFEGKVDDSFYEEEITEPQEIVKLINRINFYEVKSLNSNDKTPHYISCNQFDSENYYSWNKNKIYYLDSRSRDNEITATYDSAKRIYTLDDGRKFQIQMTGGTAELVKRTDISQQMMAATIKSFDDDANKLSKEINNTIQQIDKDIKDLKKQYNNNLFSDSEKYSEIVFKEQINAKTVLNDLLKELDNQRKRYQ